MHRPTRASRVTDIDVAYQGIAGAFGEEATVQRYGPDATRSGHATFNDVFGAVATGAADVGVVPIENSLAGSILENYDLLLEHDLHVVGEINLAVHHCLVAPPGTALSDVRVARSHPQALAQCAPYLGEHEIEAVAAANTAVAARDLAEQPAAGIAAIASARAAHIHGLEVIASDIQSRTDNTTRFFVIGREADTGAATDKASLAFTARNEPGALLACLQVFADFHLNLTKLESRPTGDQHWEYTFYVDVEAAIEFALDAALLDQIADALAAPATQLHVLGRYARA